MSVNLQKGQKVSLSKDNAGLSKISVRLGWDEATAQNSGGFGFFKKTVETIDCDAFAILLKNDKLVAKDDLVYYGNLTHKSYAVQHQGDNLTGAGDGDDEQINVDLASVPADYNRIVIGVNIYQAVKKNQNFGMIQNAFIRIVDERTGQEMCRFNLTDEFSKELAVLFGEIYRHNGEWKFNAVGMGTMDGSIGDFARRYM